MPVITKEQALAQIHDAIRGFDPDELLEVYRSILEDRRVTPEQAHADPSTLVSRLIDYFNLDMDIGTVIALWGTIFPRDHHICWDEDTDGLSYERRTREEIHALYTTPRD